MDSDAESEFKIPHTPKKVKVEKSFGDATSPTYSEANADFDTFSKKKKKKSKKENRQDDEGWSSELQSEADSPHHKKKKKKRFPECGSESEAECASKSFETTKPDGQTKNSRNKSERSNEMGDMVVDAERMVGHDDHQAKKKKKKKKRNSLSEIESKVPSKTYEKSMHEELNHSETRNQLEDLSTDAETAGNDNRRAKKKKKRQTLSEIESETPTKAFEKSMHEERNHSETGNQMEDMVGDGIDNHEVRKKKKKKRKKNPESFSEPEPEIPFKKSRKKNDDSLYETLDEASSHFSIDKSQKEFHGIAKADPQVSLEHSNKKKKHKHQKNNEEDMENFDSSVKDLNGDDGISLDDSKFEKHKKKKSKKHSVEPELEENNESKTSKLPENAEDDLREDAETKKQVKEKRKSVSFLASNFDIKSPDTNGGQQSWKNSTFYTDRPSQSHLESTPYLTKKKKSEDEPTDQSDRIDLEFETSEQQKGERSVKKSKNKKLDTSQEKRPKASPSKQVEDGAKKNKSQGRHFISSDEEDPQVDPRSVNTNGRRSSSGSTSDIPDQLLKSSDENVTKRKKTKRNQKRGDSSENHTDVSIVIKRERSQSASDPFDKMDSYLEKIKLSPSKNLFETGSQQDSKTNVFGLTEAINQVVSKSVFRKDIRTTMFTKTKEDKVYYHGEFIDQALRDAVPFPPQESDENSEESLTNVFGKVESSSELLTKFSEFCESCWNRSLPPLNVNSPLLSLPKTDKKKDLLSKFPQWKSGRFSSDEDEIILKNFGSLAASLSFSKKDCEEFLETLVSCSRSLMPARLYLGAVVGWQMLERRLAIDIFHRLINLVQLSRQDEILRNKCQMDMVAKTCDEISLNSGVKGVINHLNLGLHVQGKKLCSIIQKAKNHVAGEVDELNRGRFTIDDSCQLLELIMADQRTNDFDTVDYKSVDFKTIASQISRTERSLRQHFNTVISPAIQNLTVDRQVSILWRKKLFNMLLEDPNITCRQDINWKKVSKHVGLPLEKVRTLFKNNINYPTVDGSGPTSFRSALEAVLRKIEIEEDRMEMKGSLNGENNQLPRYIEIRKFYEANYH